MENTIYGLSNHAYHHEAPFTDYLSSTQIKGYLKSPKYAKYKFDNPDEEKSDALAFGSLFHDLMAAIAEKKSLDAGLLYWYGTLAVFQAPINGKTGQAYGAATKAYKEAYDAFLSDNADKAIASEADIELCRDMATSLYNGCGATSEQVRSLIKWAKATEVSYFYETEDGIKLKVRPDMLTPQKVIDWKTIATDDLSEENIVRQIIKYRYDVSLSMYQKVLHEITGKWYRPYLAFVSKIAPYDAVICDISEWCYNYDDDAEYDIVTPGVGAMEFKRLLDLHTECVRNNEWPGIEYAIPQDGKTRIMKPEVPYFFGRKYFEE